MKSLFNAFFAGAALLLAFTHSLSARGILWMESTYLGDGWFRYTVSAPDDPSFLFVDVGTLAVCDAGWTGFELGPPPPRWTNGPSIEGCVAWTSEDIDGWNVQRRPYSTSFLFRSGDTFKRGIATMTFSLALVTGWDDSGQVVSQNIGGYWNALVLMPGPPDDSGTNLLTSLPTHLPDPVMARLVRNGENIIGIAFDYPNSNTMRLEASRDLKSWTNITYIYGVPGRTTWTSTNLINDFGSFFRVGLVAEGHAPVLPPLNPVSPDFIPAAAARPAAPAAAGADSGVRLLSARPCIEGADLTLATTPGKRYLVTLLDQEMQPTWTVEALAAGSATVVRMPAAPPDFGFIQIKEDSR